MNKDHNYNSKKGEKRFTEEWNLFVKGTHAMLKAHLSKEQKNTKQKQSP